MKTLTTDQSKQQKRSKINKKLLLKLTIGGGVAFWVTTIATSLLPIAAEYRAAFSNWSILTVWVGSLLMGMIIGFSVSYLLLRFFEKIPTKGPILKSMILSFIALVIAIVLIDVPMILHEPSAPLYYFFIGVMFNAARFIFLGIAVGYLYKRLYASAKADETQHKEDARC
jgi:ABC-type Fe3+ transport system permease subunit